MAAELVGSDEAYAHLAAVELQRLLGRQPDAAGAAAWGAFARVHDQAGLDGALASAYEYWIRAILGL